MKEQIISIITKNINYIKGFVSKVSDNIVFEGKKNDVIKAMYNPLLQKKLEERDRLFAELKSLRQENEKIKCHIVKASEVNTLCKRKLNALNSFQEFLLSNR